MQASINAPLVLFWAVVRLLLGITQMAGVRDAIRAKIEAWCADICSLVAKCRLGAARSARLNRWAGNRSVAAKNAAISSARFKPDITRRTVVEENTSVGRHGFLRFVAAMRTSDG